MAGAFFTTTTSWRSRTSTPCRSAQRIVPAISREPSPLRWCDRWTLRCETSRWPPAFTTWTYPTTDGVPTGPFSPGRARGTWTHCRVQWRGVLPAMMLVMAWRAMSSLSMTFTRRHHPRGSSCACQGTSEKTSKWSSTNSRSSSRRRHASPTPGEQTLYSPAWEKIFSGGGIAGGGGPRLPAASAPLHLGLGYTAAAPSVPMAAHLTMACIAAKCWLPLQLAASAGAGRTSLRRSGGRSTGEGSTSGEAAGGGSGPLPASAAWGGAATRRRLCAAGAGVASRP
mmetsp:Transcript_18082/g.56630  ORF Transcript_18082/g.56630 Transcript_18082/m.56630 type:complete len:283 (+) Transcript_18082:262-1110(+)